MLFETGHITFEEFTHAIIATFIIINPINKIPIFLAFTEGKTKKDKRKMLFQCILSVFIILTVTVWVGELLLEVFQINIDAFRVGGGLLLGHLGFTMVYSDIQEIINKYGPPKHSGKSSKKSDPSLSVISVVPMALPILAGPGTIATIIIFAHIHHSFVDNLYSTVMIFIVSILILIILASGFFVRKLIGNTGLNILSRIMGLFQLSIGCNMFLTGLVALAPGLKG